MNNGFFVGNHRPRDIASRIVSLVPSQSELLFDLGLENRVVGVTLFCVHPSHWRKQKQIIGGTKTINLDRIQNLSPDLILANKEENTKHHIETLANFFPVYVSNVTCKQDAFAMIYDIGKLTGKEKKAKEINAIIKYSLDKLALQKSNIRVCYLIWKDPFYTVGGDTFISSMLELAGYQNAFENKTRYPEVDLESIKDKVDVIFLASEPYPFQEKHKKEIQALLPEKKVVLVDGELFSWYGSRMKYFAEYAKKIMQQVQE